MRHEYEQYIPGQCRANLEIINDAIAAHPGFSLRLHRALKAKMIETWDDIWGIIRDEQQRGRAA